MEKMEQLLNEHLDLHGQVQALEDEQYLLLYDQVLETLRAAESPGFWGLIRLKRMQRCFAKALTHKNHELNCSNTSSTGFRA